MILSNVLNAVKFHASDAPQFDDMTLMVVKRLRLIPVGAGGFEPPSSRTRTARSNRAEPRPEHLDYSAVTILMQVQYYGSTTDLYLQVDRKGIISHSKSSKNHSRSHS